MSLSALQIYYYPVIGFNLARTHCAQYPLPGEHSNQALLDAQKPFDRQWRSHPTGYPFNTWVENIKYRLLNLAKGFGGRVEIRTLDLHISSQAP